MKGKVFITAICLLGFIQLWASENVKEITYKVDGSKSKINWIGTKPTGQHNGTVDVTEGYVAFRNNKLTGGTFTIDLRTIVDLDLESETWNKKLVDHLKSEDFFYVEKYPTATFEITKVETLSGDDYKISGYLTMRDVTKAVSFQANIKQENSSITAITEKFTLDRTQWNVKALSKSVFSDLKDKYVDDEIQVEAKLFATLP